MLLSSAMEGSRGQRRRAQRWQKGQLGAGWRGTGGKEGGEHACSSRCQGMKGQVWSWERGRFRLEQQGMVQPRVGSELLPSRRPHGQAQAAK